MQSSMLVVLPRKIQAPLMSAWFFLSSFLASWISILFSFGGRRPPAAVRKTTTASAPPPPKKQPLIESTTAASHHVSRPPTRDSPPFSRDYDLLLKAIHRGESGSLEQFLQALSPHPRSTALTTKDSQGYSLLHHAVLKRDVQLVAPLLDAAASPPAKAALCRQPSTTMLYTPLHMAALRGDTQIIALLLRNGASPNALTKLCATPLHLAASKGHVAACRLLLEHGANVNAATKTDNTAMMSAVHNRSFELVKLLVEFGANPMITTQAGLNAMGLALSLNATDILLVLEGSVKRHGHRRTPSTAGQGT
eukprot:Protomagalhaensia_sp_Gyna_25__4815@NODE_491_length_3281_cov_198_785318_g382_i0_p1_GENE_NODE_491_length_3281_cov_198_785318_g382_i0NODE_491_length_3281_cov_198_785318_g382_i0_p1_ORF_typecomplete_len308_score45_59Ank_2/PF12796_7/4e11Ank_2/PF12796_7/1_1e17Ank_2/PF12796_7/3_6e16Ank_2/PF12796_7/0_00071Ank_5/PF13857_6/0_0016Ank_5/PF13857_6/3_4e08Ank_5/PF13857_6/1_4e12Ank_5/PF13857_6/2_3e11Ank_4/PF13637_6/1_1Ank_4/PF13637_6/7e16Ank_4/PF13637_6/1_9e16Ank_4/PF13637_6/0_082Ank_3/PF13606_6/8_4Ank_3/PF13606